MNDITRRDALKLTAISCVLPAAADATQASKPDQPADQHSPGKPAAADNADRQRIIAAGLTKDEADCRELTGQLAGTLLNLPQLHVMDDHKISHAIHVIQYRILARPTYRKYLEIAKKS